MKNQLPSISRRNLLQLAGSAAALGATALTVEVAATRQTLEIFELVVSERLDVFSNAS